VIGVPASAGSSSPQLDQDAGKYLFTGSEIHKHAFKTPTLRNIGVTAPYMHNGVFNTLEEVMEFYNKGGGAGIHTAPENQTLPADELHLSKSEIKKIIAFLETLTNDTAMSADQ
jgi:cytochrome c peroxidase